VGGVKGWGQEFPCGCSSGWGRGLLGACLHRNCIKKIRITVAIVAFATRIIVEITYDNDVSDTLLAPPEEDVAASRYSVMPEVVGPEIRMSTDQKYIDESVPPVTAI
jgi:hypothetical protein